MRKRIAVLLAGLSIAVVVGAAPADAAPVSSLFDTNWPCHGC